MPRASSSTPSLPSSISILKLARPTAWRSARQPRSRGAVVRPAEGVRGWRRWRELAVARSAHQVAVVISIPFAAIVSSSSSPLPPIEENVLPLNSATTSPKLPAIEMNEDNKLGVVVRRKNAICYNGHRTVKHILAISPVAT